MAECLFCRIVSGEIPSQKVYEDDEVFGFRDIDPQAPTHILLVPKRHLAGVQDLRPPDAGLLGRLVLAAKGLAETERLNARGYRLVLNVGSDAGQSVFHLHLHLLGGRALDWPPG